MSSTNPDLSNVSVIVTTRVFDVPRQRLFEAFSDPDQLEKWWGPKGFANTIDEFEFRVGGPWRITMHGPNGVDYPNESQFVEIVRPERIVFVHLRPMHRYTMQMNYTEEGNGTRLTWHMGFDEDEGEKLRTFISAANEENFDRLQALVSRK
jgi:uncharacterized protein YndB with AHSA1/START domain